MNRGQELVIGGFVPGPYGLDSIIVGYYKGNDLVYVARVRNGFVPASRRQVFEKLKPLVIPECPFANLLELHRSRWGDGHTPADMTKGVWVRPELVAKPNSWNRRNPIICATRALPGCGLTRTLD